MFYVSLFVCLSVCQSDYSKGYERILVDFFWSVGRGPRKSRLDFGGDPDYDPIYGSREFFKGFFIYFCDSH